MKTTIDKIRGLLAQRRIFLMGAGVGTVEDTGASYADRQAVNIQEGIQIEPYTTFWGGTGRSLVTMGAFSYTHSVLPPLISVGRYTSIAAGLKVMGESHPVEWLSTSPVFYNKRLMMSTFESDNEITSNYQHYGYRPDPISIGNDVWIGENVSLAHGVALGDGVVVASSSVVTKDVAPYTIVGGVPAKPIRSRFDPQTVGDLMRVRWWQYAPHQISSLDVRKPGAIVPALEQCILEDGLRPFCPSPATYNDFEHYC